MGNFLLQKILRQTLNGMLFIIVIKQQLVALCLLIIRVESIIFNSLKPGIFKSFFSEKHFSL